MVRTCFVCKWRGDKLPQRTYHLFPSDEKLRQQWLEILGKSGTTIGKNTVLCCIHFEENCFKYGLVHGRKFLNPGSLPTLHLNTATLDSNDIDPSTSLSTSEEQDPMEFCSIELSDNSLIEKRTDENKDILFYKKKNSSLKRVVRRLKNSKNKLKSELRALKKKLNKLETEQILSHTKLSPIPQDLYQNLTSTKKKIPTHSLPLKIFASTISYLSPKCYHYIRKVFPVLPNPSTIRKWMQNIEIRPGICEPSINILKKKFIEANKMGKKLLCNVTVDDMAIRKHVRWNGREFKGFVTYKTHQNVTRAKNVMVIMVVCLNENWKLPVAYHFINTLNGDDRALIVKNCFEKIHGTGIEAIALTFDGGLSNLTMAKKLGANMAPNIFDQWFPHPVTKQPIYILLDACHAIKLVRNASNYYKILIDKNNNIIDWDFFKKLVRVQNNFGLHTATKIRQRHVYFHHEKMKVRLATQLLSRSVSKGMEFLRTFIKHTDFKNSLGTERFCLEMNDIFDILNSRQKYCKVPSKQPIKQSNFEAINTKILSFENYVKNLKTTDTYILNSKRRLGFYGLIVSSKSCLNIFKKYGMEQRSLEYLLTYKLSQDHLELFFSGIRSKGGYNNNPTVEQFESALKWLLIYADVKGTETGNCSDGDETSILNNFQKEKKLKLNEEIISNETNLNPHFTHLNEHNYALPNIYINNEHKKYIEDVVAHIAGFVAKKILKNMKCDSCKHAFIDIQCNSALQNLKDCGKLTSASLLLINICRLAERIFREFNDIFERSNVKTILVKEVTKHIPQTSVHNDSDGEHQNKIIEKILSIYFDIRLHHVSVSEFPEEEKIRAKHTKTVLFSNQ